MNAASTIVNLVLEGMSCGHCVARVTTALTGIPGAKIISVAVGSAQIVVDEASAAQAAVDAVSRAGYPARMKGVVTSPIYTARTSCCETSRGEQESAAKSKCC